MLTVGISNIFLSYITQMKILNLKKYNFERKYLNWKFIGEY